MSVWFKHSCPAPRRLLFSSTPSPRLTASHRLLSPRPAFRTTSNQASPDRPLRAHTVSDRLVVLGLLTLTGLVGVGFGTAAKCQRATVEHEQVTPPTTLEKPNEEESGEPTGEPAPTTESSEQGAFNPETGEINWDCPCLGGMAHGVCGEQFKAAFSCFVYSEQEPKGVECIEKFKDMQDCFREHPDQYGPELVDGDESPSESEPASSMDTTEGTELGDRPEQLNTEDKEFAQRAETNGKQQTSFEVEANETPQPIPSSSASQTHTTIPIPEASQATPSIPPKAGPNAPKTINPES